jgi:8-oxo-dGTP pyrophosphatase MutT (NUDIX family)
VTWKIIHRGFLTLKKNGRMEVVEKPNAVAWIFVDPIRKVVLLVSQKREAMVRRSNPSGAIIEAPAGTRDLKTSIKNLVVKEAEEETGLLITTRQVKLINRGVPLATSPGWETERVYLAYVETDLGPCMKKGQGRRVFGLKAHGERIRRRVVTFEELEQMTFHDLKTFALVQWFLKEQLQIRRSTV